MTLDKKFENYICPISHCIFMDPVIAEDGFTYERTEIINWLKNNNTSPITRDKINKIVLPNQFAKTIITEKLQKNPQYKQHQYEIILPFSEILKQKAYTQILKIQSFTLNDLNILLNIYNKDLDIYIVHMVYIIGPNKEIILKNNIQFSDEILWLFVKQQYNIFMCSSKNIINLLFEANNFEIIKYYFEITNIDTQKKLIKIFNSSHLETCIKNNQKNIIVHIVEKLNYKFTNINIDYSIKLFVDNAKHSHDTILYAYDKVRLVINYKFIEKFNKCLVNKLIETYNTHNNINIIIYIMSMIKTIDTLLLKKIFVMPINDEHLVELCTKCSEINIVNIIGLHCEDFLRKIVNTNNINMEFITRFIEYYQDNTFENIKHYIDLLPSKENNYFSKNIYHKDIIKICDYINKNIYNNKHRPIINYTNIKDISEYNKENVLKILLEFESDFNNISNYIVTYYENLEKEKQIIMVLENMNNYNCDNIAISKDINDNIIKYKIKHIKLETYISAYFSLSAYNIIEYILSIYSIKTFDIFSLVSNKQLNEIIICKIANDYFNYSDEELVQYFIKAKRYEILVKTFEQYRIYYNNDTFSTLIEDINKNDIFGIVFAKMIIKNGILKINYNKFSKYIKKMYNKSYYASLFIKYYPELWNEIECKKIEIQSI